MIGRQIKGRSFRGLLAYIQGKEGARLIGGNMIGASPKDLAREFADVCELRPRLKRVVFHLPLSLPPGEALSDEQWNAIARRVLAGLGFSSAPFVVYHHSDTGCQHVHVVASRVTFEGGVVSDSNDYYRSMRLLRDVERDHGLRVVISESGLKAPSQGERRLVEKTGSAEARKILQAAVQRAAQGRPTFSVFAARLRERGIEPVAHVASTGRVQGISFLYQDVAYKGSSLGRGMTWQGLLRQGIAYDPERDLPQLLRAADRIKRLPRASPAAQAEPHSAPARDVERQLEALGAARFELVLLHTETGAMDVRRLDAREIVTSLDWLAEKNRSGSEILIRPADHRFHLVADIPAEGLAAARAAGLEPAAVVRVGERYEAWFKDRETVPVENRPYLSALLAESLGVDPRRSLSDRGHLAGFSSTLEQWEQRLAEAPRVQVTESSGRAYGAFDDVAAGARRFVEERHAESAVSAELSRLADEARQGGLPLPWQTSTVQADLTDRFRKAFAAYQAASDAHSMAPPQDLRSGEALVDAYRRLREVGGEVERITGRALGSRIGPEEIGEYLHLCDRLETAWQRPTGSLNDADRLARQALVKRLGALEGGPAARGKVEEILAREDGGLRLHLERAASPREAAAAELALEAHRHDLRSAVRELRSDLGLLRVELDRAERGARLVQSASAADRYQAALEAYLRAETRLLGAEGQLRQTEHFALERNVSRLRETLGGAPSARSVEAYRELVHGQQRILAVPSGPDRPAPAPSTAARELLARPSPEGVRHFAQAVERDAVRTARLDDLIALRELTAARRELRSAAQLAGEAPRAGEALDRLSRAHVRYEAAQAHLADRLDRHLAPARAAALDSLLLRVRSGDQQIETLRDLERHLAGEVFRTKGVLPASPVGSRVSLGSAVRDLEAGRLALRRELRRGLPGSSLPVDRLERLHATVRAMRSRAEQIDRAFARMERSVLPLRSFLRHPELGRDADAVRAWAAHAARRGLGETRILSTLVRAGAATSRATLQISAFVAARIASEAVRWSVRLAAQLARQLSRSR